MNKRWNLGMLIVCNLAYCALLSVPMLPAQDADKPQPVAETRPRELLVPFHDLHLLLGNETRRVFMTREELAQLKAAAKTPIDEPLPQQVALLSAQYDAQLENGRAVLTGQLQIEVLAEGLHALPLTISGVGIRSAQLDNQPAALTSGDNGVVQLIVQGQGLHQLELEMTLPVATAAAQQSLTWTVPVPPATRFHLSVPGNVEMKSGAAILSRRVNDAAGRTHFDLLPSQGAMNLVMSLNNKRLRDETTTLARGVLISEITQGYQRLHANLSMNVVHGGADEFRIGVPDDYEITQVTSPLLARWSVEQSDEAASGKVLVVKLRELVNDRTTIQLRADRLKPALGPWQMPKLEPLKVAGFASVVGILIEEQMASQSIDSEQLIPIDNQILTAALPPSVLAQEPGAPRIRPLATFYAAQPEFELRTSFVVQPAELKVTTNLMLTLNERGLEMNGGFALLPSSEKLFAFDFVVPAAWTVDSVTLADGKPLSYERYQAGTNWRVRVQLPGGLASGATQSVLFHANSTPTGWLGDWNEQTIALPQISVVKTEQVHETGAFAVRSFDDLKLQPEGLSGLIVISDSEKSKYGCADVPLAFAWRYSEEPWQGSLKVTRATPRMTGRAMSFYKVDDDALVAHYELFFDVEQARAQRLSFSLPVSTPAEVTVRGLGDTVVKETTSQVVDDRRNWTVQLADKKIGRAKLAIDFTQPIPAQQLANWTLPEIRAENVDYQTGLVAVEGDVELDINVVQHPRSVDMGELIDAEYQVGSRLLGVYSYIGNQGAVTIQGQRRQSHGLPTTIVERAELVSLLGTGGNSQTAARFLLRTKAQYLEVRLPEAATLWSIMVDGIPSLPERQADHVVVSLKSASANQLRDVQVVYEHSIRSIGLRSRVQLLAPSLWHRADRDTASEPVPLVDLKWEAVLPTGYRLVQHDGTVTLQNSPQSPWYSLDYWATTLSMLGGGVHRYQLPHIVSISPKTAAPRVATSEERESFQAWDAKPDVTFDVSQPQLPPTSQPQAVQPPPPQQSAAAATSGVPADPFSDESKNAFGIQSRSNNWAIEGLRCLSIDLTPAKFGESVTFVSLGIEPALIVTVANERRWEWLGVAAGLLMFVLGLARIENKISARLRYALLVVVGAMLLALVSGWTVEMEPVVRGCIIAAVVLVMLSIFARSAGTLFGKAKRLVNRNQPANHFNPENITSVSSPVLPIILAVLTSSMLWPTQTAHAQQSPATPVTNVAELAAMIDALPGNPSIPIPADAIVVPYDPSVEIPGSQPGLSDQKQKLLVPYDTYVRLWNAAHPEERLSTTPPPVPYAWASAQYNATLSGNDALEVTGSFRLELFSDAGVTIPLTLAGGVLQSITADGKPARVQLLEPNPAPQPAQSNQQQVQIMDRPEAAPAILLLHLSGKGFKDIQIAVRMKIERRGGWRAVEGRLPAAPATSLTLRVPEAQTEVRLTGMADRASHEIEKAEGIVETALPADGRAAWQWRAKIAEAVVDQGLSVEARSVFDVQEDGLRFTWQGNFEFRRGRRESFTLLIPSDYLVQKVLGNNIRGWNIRTADGSQQLTVDLLAAVAERETFVVQLFRKHDSQSANGDAQTLEAPVIRVPDAMLQKGQLTIRRSRLLDLRSGNSSGLSRIDMPDNSQWLAEQSDVSPVALVPFQAFQFSQVPYRYQLTAQPTQSRVQATVRTLLNLSELESSLESQLILNINERQLYRLRVSVPKNWKVQTPATPAPFEWHRAINDNDQTIEIHFSDGVQGAIPIVLRGPLTQSLTTGPDGVIPSIPLPKIVVENVDQQSGDIVVAADPAFAVRAEQMQNCELGLLGTANAWLAAAQQRLAQLLVHYSNPDIAGQLQVTRRVAQVTGYSISNIKVTDRSIEETLFFEFKIRTAGIRQVSLIVPAYLARCRVRGPLIRSETWTPVSSDAGAPVRLIVELQEDVMGQYSLVLEHDRVLASGTQSAPIPEIETGKTEHRFITIENSGRDELTVDKTSGMERLQRSQSQWNVLASLLGGKTNEAFVVSDQAQSPSLSYSTKDRAMVETVGARIGIAQTLMIVDDNGAYRASQEYRVENRTEQSLEIELPADAELWTVTVAGEPVKPMTTTTPAGSGQRVRLPLVKTAAGDLDYPVVIKYGGRLPRPGALGTTRFPLVKTVNINVELSQVRLRLPPGLRWWNFGGSMARVQSEDELTAGWLSFRTRQLTELTQILSKSAKLDFSRARALSNLKQLGAEVQQYQANAQGRGNEDLQRQLSYNGAAWFEAQKELQKPTDIEASSVSSSNRFALNSRVQTQQNDRSLNVANSPESNFQVIDELSNGQLKVGEFDAKWLAGNSLKGVVAGDELAQAEAAGTPMIAGGRIAKGKDNADAYGAQLAKPAAPQLQQPSKAESPAVQSTRPETASEDRATQLYRYQQQLERRSGTNRANNAPTASPSGPGAGSGESGSAYTLPQPPAEPLPGIAGSQLGGAMQPGGLGGMGGGMGMGGNTANMQFDMGAFQAVPQLGQSSNPGLASQSAPAGYLVSLDTQLPVRGDEYLFSTPRGATEITAQSIGTDTLKRWTMVAVLLVLGAMAWVATHRVPKLTVSRWLRITLGVTCLLLGLIWLVSGITPLYAMVVLAIALLLILS